MSEVAVKKPEVTSRPGKAPAGVPAPSQASPPPAPSPAKAFVGMMVQYHNGTDGVVPGWLQRKCLTEDKWDVKISLNGAAALVTRAAVGYSPVPKVGYWSPLPE